MRRLLLAGFDLCARVANFVSFLVKFNHKDHNGGAKVTPEVDPNNRRRRNPLSSS